MFVVIAAFFYYFIINRMFGYVCPSMIIVGLPCPGCGLTRAALCLIRGDIGGSLRMNPMLLFIAAYAVLVVLKKKTAAEYYLIIISIISFMVFGWRMTRSFGTEPLVYNANSVIGHVMRIFGHRAAFLN